MAGGLLLAVDDGGFPSTVWYPAALFALVLVTIVVVAAPPATLGPRVLVVALGAYALLTVLAFASIAWADTESSTARSEASSVSVGHPSGPSQRAAWRRT